MNVDDECYFILFYLYLLFIGLFVYLNMHYVIRRENNTDEIQPTLRTCQNSKYTLSENKQVHYPKITVKLIYCDYIWEELLF